MKAPVARTATTIAATSQGRNLVIGGFYGPSDTRTRSPMRGESRHVRVPLRRAFPKLFALLAAEICRVKMISRTWIGLLAMASVFAACSSNPSGATVLDMPEGEATESFEFEAMDPSQWVFTVIVTAPIGAVVDVTFLTADGATLSIFETPSDSEEAGCVEESEGFLDCVNSFPLLEAREPGTWTASVHKTSEQAAEVHLNVAWENVSDDG
jgi:hypothetical protein